MSKEPLIVTVTSKAGSSFHDYDPPERRIFGEYDMITEWWYDKSVSITYKRVIYYIAETMDDILKQLEDKGDE